MKRNYYIFVRINDQPTLDKRKLNVLNLERMRWQRKKKTKAHGDEKYNE